MEAPRGDYWCTNAEGVPDCKNDGGEFFYCPDGLQLEDTVTQVILALIALQTVCCVVLAGCTKRQSRLKKSAKKELKALEQRSAIDETTMTGEEVYEEHSSDNDDSAKIQIISQPTHVMPMGATGFVQAQPTGFVHAQPTTPQFLIRKSL